ncbi:exocyst complex component Sec5-domain-containing protein [Lipomyces arxii]|uniref:exocyst complex component Sec5-domain-containing protein n=1 Tax=Lipomyces arxii TaxID=56418 RepID=UPI0034CFCDE8
MVDSVYKYYGLSDPFPTVWEDNLPDEREFTSVLGNRQYGLGNQITEKSRNGSQTPDREASQKLQYKFDMFVKMKSTLDISYIEMRRDFLQEPKKWGLSDIEALIDDSNVKAAQIMMPIMDNKIKGDRLKATLTLIDKHRYLFDLPATLAENINRGDNDALIRDYRRGRSLTEEIRTLPHLSDLSDHLVQQRRVIERIWEEVEVVVDDYKNEIWKQLINTRADDNYQLYFSILLELGVEDNPIWVWLESQVNKLNERMKVTFAELNTSLSVLRQNIEHSKQPTTVQMNATFLDAIKLSLLSNSAQRDLPEVVRMWATVSEIMDEVTAHFGKHISLYWESALALLEGRTQKTLPIGQNGESRVHLTFSREEESKIRSDALELTENFSNYIAEFFTNSVPDLQAKIESTQEQDGDNESDMPEAEPKDPGSRLAPSASTLLADSLKSDRQLEITALSIDTTPPLSKRPSSPGIAQNYVKYAFLPPGSNSMSATYFLSHMLGAIASVSSELAGLSISSQHVDSLRDMLGIVREQCVSAVALAWQQDARRFRMLEDWQPAVARNGSKIPDIFLAFQRVVLEGLRQLAFISSAEKRSQVNVVMPPSSKLTSNIKTQFVNSIFLMLDGLVKDAIATDKSSPLQADTEESNAQTETKMLLMLCNLQEFRTVVTTLFEKFSELFTIQLTDNSNIIGDAIQRLDDQLFANFTKKKRAQFTSIIRQGVLKSGISWSDLEVPMDVSPYIYRALLQLVTVHAQVSSIASTLVRRVIYDLLYHLVTVLLDSLRHIDRFSVGGMLQATIDVELINQKMADYRSPELDKLYQSCYSCVQDATTESGIEIEVMTRSLEDMKRLLIKCHRNSRLEFACFRKEK